MSLRYHDLTVEIRSREDGRFDATAFSDQFQDRPRVSFRRPIGRRAVAAIHAEVSRRAGGGALAEPWAGGRLKPRVFGARLHLALFQGEVARLLDRCRAAISGETGVGLRLRLTFDPRDPQAPYLADLPWELLCDPEDGQFVAADNRTAVVRQIDRKSVV